MILICISLMSMMLNVFVCNCWSCMCLLWKNVQEALDFFFSLAIEFHEFFKNMFRTLNPNKIYICQRFVSFGRLIFLMSPLLCRSF